MTKKPLISESRKSLQNEVMMLRTQGFTVRQVCNLLQIKSTDTVFKQLKNSLEQNRQRKEITVLEYKDLEMNRCDERFGRLAEWRNKVEQMNISPERQLTLMLSLEDRDLKNQERLIKLLNLESSKIESEDTIDFNALRERAAHVDAKQREIELNPALSGRVR